MTGNALSIVCMTISLLCGRATRSPEGLFRGWQHEFGH